MSAYVVSQAHIDLLVSAAVTWRRLDFYNSPSLSGAPELSQTTNPDAIGAALWAENVRSVNYRYNSEEAETVPAYTWRDLHPTGAPLALIVLKACDCFDYQACETEDYESRWAARWIDQLRKQAISQLPGYDKAPGWGYERTGSEPISLLAMSQGRA